MKILAFTGMPASGKSEAVTVVRQLRIPVIRMGDCVWEETEKQGLSLTDENVGFVANSMRELHGKDIWAQRTVKKISVLKQKKIIVIDGIRNPEEITYFKKILGDDFQVIAITAPDAVRRKRVASRKRSDDTISKKAMKERDKRELGWGLGEVIASADVVIENNASLDEFHKKIKSLF
jgi:dephospho-CoA kinase